VPIHELVQIGEINFAIAKGRDQRHGHARKLFPFRPHPRFPLVDGRQAFASREFLIFHDRMLDNTRWPFRMQEKPHEAPASRQSNASQPVFANAQQYSEAGSE
jgi:hypothetical protein